MTSLYKVDVNIYVEFLAKERTFVKDLQVTKMPVLKEILSDTKDNFVVTYVLEGGEEVSTFEVNRSSAEYNDYVRISNYKDSELKDGYAGILYFDEERFNYHGGEEGIKNLIVENLVHMGLSFNVEDYKYFNVITLRLDVKSGQVAAITTKLLHQTNSKGRHYLCSPIYMDITLEGQNYQLPFKPELMGDIVYEESEEYECVCSCIVEETKDVKAQVLQVLAHIEAKASEIVRKQSAVMTMASGARKEIISELNNNKK